MYYSGGKRHVMDCFRSAGESSASKGWCARAVSWSWCEISWSRVGFILRRILLYSDGTPICSCDCWRVCTK